MFKGFITCMRFLSLKLDYSFDFDSLRSNKWWKVQANVINYNLLGIYVDLVKAAFSIGL